MNCQLPGTTPTVQIDKKKALRYAIAKIVCRADNSHLEDLFDEIAGSEDDIDLTVADEEALEEVKAELVAKIKAICT